MSEPVVPADLTNALQRAVADFFTVETVFIDPGRAQVIRLYGSFLIDPDEAYPLAQRRFDTLGYTSLFRREKGQVVIVAIPGKLPESKQRLRTVVVLFALTVLSIYFVGVQWQTDPALALGSRLLEGLTYALPLLAILVAHESGHYLVARRLGIPATLPYFIPLPLPVLGTMGAVIVTRVPPRNRRHLLLLGAAGPLAGLIVALPLLFLGLSLSKVQPALAEGGILEGNSILYALAKTLFFGQFLPSCSPETTRSLQEVVRTALYGCPVGVGQDVFLHPLAFAAWAGLFLTGFNLIPAGTLDGGQVAYALFGEKAYRLTFALILGLILLGFFWMGWWLLAGLLFVLGRNPAVPLNDISPLKPGHVALGVLVLVVFLLTFMPIPLQILQ